MKFSYAVVSTLGLVSAQQIGKQKTEFHPAMKLSSCTKSGGCQSSQKSVTMDSNWRWTHNTDGYFNCYSGAQWNSSFCPDPVACVKNCAVDGVSTDDMKKIYGVSSDGTALKLNLVTGSNVGSRLYMLADENTYQMFKMKNKEFSFTVDVSKLPCGVNGALYFVEMDSDGGKSKYPADKAGAKYGTGYCDAQCPHDMKFINGEANMIDWDNKTQHGKYGSCCAEFDVWEANSISSAFTAHPCTVQGQTRCNDDSGTDCGDGGRRYNGVCDKDGCDLNAYRAGLTDFLGPGSTFNVDTTKPFQVVTQFLTDDGTDSGTLTEVKRIFVQDGKVIEHPQSKLGGAKEYNSLSDDMCEDHKKIFGDANDYKTKGGMKAMGDAFESGMVLVLSLWDDHDANMLWLDSTYPTDRTAKGGPRGSCPIDSGKPDDVEKNHPDSSVIYSDVKVGEIGSTFSHGPTPAPPAPPTPGGCPGGSLRACIDLCPADPAVAFQACTSSCVKRCPSSEEFII